ncbi:hypothetical protein H0H81_004315 [Sphagnurus paluster]|uniref:Uncharacterized protein n=1 Tax=Sphagnurus paluster TaxID=117069 RepID=A0A9P7K2A6_9AGAR|nr:hypothetical protein H0H81_004315 [Sphagnurus paluster]
MINVFQLLGVTLVNNSDNTPPVAPAEALRLAASTAQVTLANSVSSSASRGTLAAALAHSHKEYMAMAQLGVSLEGHEFDAVITPAERTKAEHLIADDKETAEFCKMLIDDIEERELANQAAKGKVAEVDDWYFSYV